MAHAAGIVLFNPDIKRLEENISAISPQVGSLILVDNGSKNIDDIKKLIEGYGNITYIRNDDNYGIAKALDQIINKADELGAEWKKEHSGPPRTCGNEEPTPRVRHSVRAALMLVHCQRTAWTRPLLPQRSQCRGGEAASCSLTRALLLLTQPCQG